MIPNDSCLFVLFYLRDTVQQNLHTVHLDHKCFHAEQNRKKDLTLN